MIQKNKISESEKIVILKRIEFNTDLSQSVTNSDLIIEAATESKKIKLEIFKKLDELCKPETILASNTSSISIGEIAAVTNRKDKVIGMHFMNPVPIMELVEVIQSCETSKTTVELIMDLAKKLHKKPVLVNDAPGFVANRILLPMINEAIQALEEGVSGVQEIDTVMILGMSHPMGPLQLADFIGLDVCLSILEVLHQGLKDPKYKPNKLLKKLVKQNELGIKTKKGFYDYTQGIKNKMVSERFK
tara:strand:- start:11 stop:748 length:738 start_codon:yes stop_codon:yes gene_type:complete